MVVAQSKAHEGTWGWLRLVTQAALTRCLMLVPGCRYLLRVSMTGKGMVTDTKKDAPFWVRNFDVPPEEAPPIKMEVGGHGAVLLHDCTAACAGHNRMCQRQQLLQHCG